MYIYFKKSMSFFGGTKHAKISTQTNKFKVLQKKKKQNLV